MYLLWWFGWRKHKGMQYTDEFPCKELHLCMYICGLTWWPWSRSLSLLCWWHRWCKIGASPPPLCRQSLFCMPWSSALDCWDCTVPDSTRNHMIVNLGIYQLKYIKCYIYIMSTIKQYLTFKFWIKMQPFVFTGLRGCSTSLTQRFSKGMMPLGSLSCWQIKVQSMN